MSSDRKDPQPATRDTGRAAAMLVITEEQLNQMFLHWPLEDKLQCVQNWLDREAQ